MPKCKHECFKCPYDDCIVDSVTLEERKAMRERDIKFADYGHIIPAKQNRANRRKKYYGN